VFGVIVLTVHVLIGGMTMENCEKCYHRRLCCIVNFDKCEYFKDKSLFVELPCKIDDTVYMLGHESIMVLTVSNISLVPYPLVECEDTECEEYAGTYQFETKDFGKTVFLTFGEATKALEERENNDS
jgi:hypothetical protein